MPISGEAEGDGSVEGIILLPQNGRSQMKVLLCVFLDKDLVATFDPLTGEFNNKEDVEPCDKMASYLALESFAVQVEGERWLPEGSKAASILQGFLGDSGTQRMVDLWSPFAHIPELSESERPNAVSVMSKGGFKNALALEESDLRNVARVSLLPLGSLLKRDKSTADADEYQWVEVVNRKCIEALGFPLLTIKDGRLAPSRV